MKKSPSSKKLLLADKLGKSNFETFIKLTAEGKTLSLILKEMPDVFATKGGIAALRRDYPGEIEMAVKAYLAQLTGVPSASIVTEQLQELVKEESLETKHNALVNVLAHPDLIFAEPPDLASERDINEKRAGADDLIQAARKGGPVTETYALRAYHKREGVSTFLMHMGYVPAFAKLVEDILDLMRRQE